MISNIKYLFIALLDIALAVITLFLGARILLKLLSANPLTPIVSWVYNLTDTLIFPFRDIFPYLQTSSTGVLDVTAVITMIAYIIVFYLIIYLISSIPDHTHHVVHETTKEI